MAHDLTANVFGNHLDANFHGRRTGVVHAGQKGHQLAHMDRLQEHDLVHAQRDAVASCIAAGAGVGHFVQFFQNGAPVHIAGEVGHVGGHQHRHAELV